MRPRLLRHKSCQRRQRIDRRKGKWEFTLEASGREPGSSWPFQKSFMTKSKTSNMMSGGSKRKKQSSSSRRQRSSSSRPRRTAGARAESHLEKQAALLMMGHHLPKFEREFRFHETRRWRFDFAWPERYVALEVEGGIWNRGRHTSPKGFIADCEKYNSALVLGWKVLRVTLPDIKEGRMIDWLKAILPAP